MDQATFEQIKVKHGAYASWAVWAEPDHGPKSNIGDLGVLDPAHNPTLLDTLRNDVVMLGLNLSRPALLPFANFHDARPEGQDYKIRYAFSGTPYYRGIHDRPDQGGGGAGVRQSAQAPEQGPIAYQQECWMAS